jgi:hypothetical protein
MAGFGVVIWSEKPSGRNSVIEDRTDFDLADMIRAVWDETHEVDCSKLRTSPASSSGMRVTMISASTDLIGDQCFALLSGEGQPVYRIDPRFTEALVAAMSSASERRAAYADLIAMINEDPATSFRQIWLDMQESDPGKAAQEILTRMSQDARELLDARGLTEGVLQAIAESYSMYLAQMTSAGGEA